MTGAELHLAAYEALANVIAASYTVPISQFLDFSSEVHLQSACKVECKFLT